MPIPFILLGILTLYMIMFHIKNIKNITIIMALLSFCSMYMTQSTIINNRVGINIAGLVGIVICIVYSLIARVSIRAVIASILSATVYACVTKIDIECHYLFSTTALMVTIFVFGLLCSSVGDLLLYTALTGVMYSIVSTVYAYNNMLYSTLFAHELMGAIIVSVYMVGFVKVIEALIQYCIVKIKLAKGVR